MHTDLFTSRASDTALGLAGVGTGVMAGVFHAFDTAVMPALAETDDRTFVDTMRSVNRLIENPVFGLAYVGALAAPAAAAVLLHRAGRRRAARWAAGAALCYGAAVVVTSAVNLPLNARLARTPDATAARAGFERRWNTANTARTVLTVAAAACVGRAATLRERGTSRAGESTGSA
ncbi:DUF1772 domain-containing protein [Micromonospora sp. NPDC051925]|uniref:DUF1772 domain-containing protein n=1 Tax=Micromonospora sp. NPDC051925 TaxID=3364288 RepID=UPI0037C74729